MTNQKYLNIKEAAQLYNRSEQTIRRLVKQHILTDHIRSEDTPKGKAYQISSVLLQQKYEAPIVVNLPTPAIPNLLQQDNQQLREAIAERDRTIQQLQNKLFEQGDIINAMANQMANQLTSQKMGRIEELLIQQNAQIGDLQKRLPTLGVDEPAPDRRSLWSRLFGR